MLSWLEISQSALQQNFRVFSEIVGKDRVAPVVKSNAYGHGFDETVRILLAENPAFLCVNYAEEGVRLRQLGFKGRVIVVGAATRDSMMQAAQHQIEVFLSSLEAFNIWKDLGSRPKIHVKIDTGMSRQGFLTRDAGTVAPLFKPYASDVVAICTHFANIEDVTEQGYAFQQLREFEAARAAFAAEGITAMAHTAASASCLILEKSRYDLCRIGISMYGLWPSQATKISYLQEFGKLPELVPALSWRTRVTLIKPVEAGKFIGYGCTFRAIRDMKVAVLPVGYYEGYPRIAGSTSSYVLIRGKRCPIVGRLCMNMLMVDVSHVTDAETGDIATLIGTEGSETLTAADLGTWAQTIHYEIVTRIHPLIPRRIVP